MLGIFTGIALRCTELASLEADCSADTETSLGSPVSNVRTSSVNKQNKQLSHTHKEENHLLETTTYVNREHYALLFPINETKLPARYVHGTRSNNTGDERFFEEGDPTRGQHEAPESR